MLRKEAELQPLLFAMLQPSEAAVCHQGHAVDVCWVSSCVAAICEYAH